MSLLDMFLQQHGITGINPSAPDPILPVNKIMAGAQRYGSTITPPATFRTAKTVGPSLLDRISNGVAGPAPAGIEGLLSPEDLQSAKSSGLMDLGMSLLADSGPKTASERVGLGQALGRGLQAARQGYQDRLGNAVGIQATLQQMKAAKLAQETGEVERDTKKLGLQTAKGLTEGRKKITAAYPMPNDVSGMKQWIDQVLPHFIALNDTDTVGSLAEIRKSLNQKDQMDIGTVNRGNVTEFYDKTTGQTIRTAPNGADPTQGGPKMDPRETANRTDTAKIMDDFRADTSDLQKAAQAYGVIQGSMDGKNPAQPIAMLYAYARLLDPGSVVREGEIATLQKIGSYDSKVRQALQKASTGTLPQDVIDHIAKQAKSVMRERKSSFKQYRDTALKRGDALGITNLDQILNDPYAAYNLDDEQQAGMPGVVGGSSSTAGGARPSLDQLRSGR